MDTPKIKLIFKKLKEYTFFKLTVNNNINFKERKILWAKNFKIPFRSNIKIFKNKIITSNQNNDLYFIDKKNGDLLRLIPTEETSVKNNFVNNLSLSRSNTYFLNTFGSLYAFDNESIFTR